MKIHQLFFLFFSLLFCNLFISCQEVEKKEQDARNDVITDSRTANIQNTFSVLDVIGFQQKLKEKNVVLIDVRKPLEIRKGKIEGALEIDVTARDFYQKVKTLNKDITYLIYDATGRRGVRACRKLAEMGFKNLYNLSGGYNAWKRIILKEVMYQDTVGSKSGGE